MNDWCPITPQQVWHFRQSIDYSITANRAVLDFASRYRETLLYRIYQMGRDEIQWGSEDHWTFTPHKSATVEMATCGTSTRADGRGPAGRGAAAGGGRGAAAERRGARAAAVADAAAARWPAALRGADDEGTARSARLHHAVRSAGLRQRRASS